MVKQSSSKFQPEGLWCSPDTLCSCKSGLCFTWNCAKPVEFRRGAWCFCHLRGSCLSWTPQRGITWFWGRFVIKSLYKSYFWAKIASAGPPDWGSLRRPNVHGWLIGSLGLFLWTDGFRVLRWADGFGVLRWADGFGILRWADWFGILRWAWFLWLRRGLGCRCWLGCRRGLGWVDFRGKNGGNKSSSV